MQEPAAHRKGTRSCAFAQQMGLDGDFSSSSSRPAALPLPFVPRTPPLTVLHVHCVHPASACGLDSLLKPGLFTASLGTWLRCLYVHTQIHVISLSLHTGVYICMSL